MSFALPHQTFGIPSQYGGGRSGTAMTLAKRLERIGARAVFDFNTLSDGIHTSFTDSVEGIIAKHSWGNNRVSNSAFTVSSSTAYNMDAHVQTRSMVLIFNGNISIGSFQGSPVGNKDAVDTVKGYGYGGVGTKQWSSSVSLSYWRSTEGFASINHVRVNDKAAHTSGSKLKRQLNDTETGFNMVYIDLKATATVNHLFSDAKGFSWGSLPYAHIALFSKSLTDTELNDLYTSING